MLAVQVPHEYVELCESWHSGQSDLLYAISSTGNLTIGNRRPLGCDTDEKWHLSLFEDLTCDIGYAVRTAAKASPNGHGDLEQLKEFQTWADDKATELRTAYALDEWERD